MILRIVVYHIKKRWYIMNSPIYGFSAAILVSAIAPKMGVEFIVFLAMLATIVLSVPLVSELSRSEVDFVFSTPADPRFIFIWTFLADWFLYSLGFMLCTPIALLTHTPIALYAALLQRPADPFLYIASIAVPAATLGVFVRMLSFLRFEKLAWLVVPIAGAALLTFELVRPNQYWIAITSLIVTLVYLPLQEYYTRELYTNAYGLLERPQPRPRPAVAPGPMPRGLWQLVWRTSGGIIEPLIMAAYISAAGVVAYLLAVLFPLHVDSQGLTLVFATLVVLLLLWDWHSSGLPSERLWISFSADHYAYVRYRMAARSLASLLATSPWIFAHAFVAFVWPRYPPAAYMAASLASASLTFPILAWLIGTLWGQPQIREYGLVQRPARYTAKSLLSLLPVLLTIGLYLAPAFLAAAGYSMSAVWLSAFIVAFSAAFFYIALFTRLGRGLWDWLIDRLAKVGYV